MSCCKGKSQHRACVPGGPSRGRCCEESKRCDVGCCPKNDTCEERECFYIKGNAIQPRPDVPGILVEKGTELFPACTIKGKMQRMAFDFAQMYGGSIDDIDKSLQILDCITYPDSQLYYPSSFGFEYNKEIIRENLILFGEVYTEASVWFPANGWTLDTTKKHGVVGSGGQKKNYFQFCVEVQFRQKRDNSGPGDERLQWQVTNDVWEFFVDEKLEKFYQVKEWLDGQVRRLQVRSVKCPGEDNCNCQAGENTTVRGSDNVGTSATILTRDYESVNLTPWPIVGGCLGSGFFETFPNGLAKFGTTVDITNFPFNQVPNLTTECMADCDDKYTNEAPDPNVVSDGKSCCVCKRRCRC